MRIGGSIFGALVVAACLLGSPALAQVYGNLTVGFWQGFAEHIVRNGPGNSFNISCDQGATPDGETKRTSIYIEIIGKDPPPNSQVQVFLDGDPVRLAADAKGVISTDCHSCSDNFAYLWAKARKSKQMIVLSPEAKEDRDEALFQFSHELAHCLYPMGGRHPPMIEEGCCVKFSLEAPAYSDPSYAEQAVKNSDMHDTAWVKTPDQEHEA